MKRQRNRGVLGVERKLTIKKVSVGIEKVLNDTKKVLNDTEKASNVQEKVLFDKLNYILENSAATRIMKNNILKLFEGLDENQVFGQKEVMEILNCGISNAGKVIGAMKELQIIQPVKEKGNGRYVFYIS